VILGIPHQFGMHPSNYPPDITVAGEELAVLRSRKRTSDSGVQTLVGLQPVD